jgi:hypothetical protein
VVLRRAAAILDLRLSPASRHAGPERRLGRPPQIHEPAFSDGGALPRRRYAVISVPAVVRNQDVPIEDVIRQIFAR